MVLQNIFLCTILSNGRLFSHTKYGIFRYNMERSIENKKEIFSYVIPDALKPALANRSSGSSEYIFMNFFTPGESAEKENSGNSPAKILCRT